MKATILVAIIYFSVLSGCSSSRHQQLVELGFERAYLDGYQDGCYSRSMAGKRIRMVFDVILNALLL